MRFRNACFLQCPGYRVTRVVNQDVDFAGCIQGRRHGVLYALVVGDIHQNELGLGDGFDATRGLLPCRIRALRARLAVALFSDQCRRKHR